MDFDDSDDSSAELDFISSDEDDDVILSLLTLVQQQAAAATSPQATHGGSVLGRQGNLDRGRREGEERLLRDYFGLNGTPTLYTDETFRRRFRMSRRLFLRIVDSLESQYAYFQQKPDAARRLGL